MATATLPKLKIKKPMANEIYGTGDEMTWADVAELDFAAYMKRTMKAVHYYDYHYSRKDGADWFRTWFKASYPQRVDDLKALNATPDSRFTTIMCAVYPMAIKGWVPNMRIMRHIVKFLKPAITQGHEIIAVNKAAAAEKAAKLGVKPKTIQDHIRDQVLVLIEPIEETIDNYIRNPAKWDPKDVKAVNVLKGDNCKAAQARMVKDYYAGPLAEYTELMSAKPDPQLVEGYRHYDKKELKKMYEFLVSIQVACDQIIGEMKAIRKPRVKKAPAADALVKNAKFKLSDNTLGLVGVTPVNIIGANVLVTYNVRLRKIATYYATNVDPTGAGRGGLSVKGQTIIGFDEKKSEQRTVRKPEEIFKKFAKETSNLKKFEAFLAKEIRTTSVGCTGRLNEDTILLKVYK